MAAFTKPSPGEVTVWLKGLDLGPFEGLEPVPAGSVNSNFALRAGGRRWFLRIYEEQDEAGAQNDAALAAALSDAGVPTARPIARADGTTVRGLCGKPAALFEWLDGDVVCQRGVEPGHAHEVGVALAKVHAAGLERLAPPSRFSVDNLFKRIDSVAEDRRFAHLALALADRLRVIGAAIPTDLPAGLVHGDLFRDNVLWAAPRRLAALLDFESASHGAFVFDFAVTLLAWCFGDAFDPALATALAAGYESVRPFASSEKLGLWHCARLAALRFQVTRLTDYEMKGGEGRVMKDWRRFEARLAALDDMGAAGLATLTGLGTERRPPAGGEG